MTSLGPGGAADVQHVLDDEAIEQFGQALESLGEAELATHAFSEGETADTAVTSLPPAPF